MTKRTSGTSTPATVALSKAGRTFTLHRYRPDPNARTYGEAAADALGVAPERIFKTLVASVDTELVVAVVPVAGTLDLKALAAARAAKRAAMADPAEVERVTGYVVGGVSPLGQRKALPTVVDESALVAALEEGRIAAAAVDCVREEPLPRSSALWGTRNLLITPHTAGETQRYEDRGVRTNAEADGELLDTVATPDDAGRKLLADAAAAMRLSARGFHRVLRVARTIADLAGAERVGRIPVAEALSYRRQAPRN